MIATKLARWTGSVTRSRKLLSCTGFAGGALFLLIAIQMTDPLLAVLTLGLASFSNDLNMPGAWGSCMDIGGKYAGTVAGSMNMMGNLAGFAAPAVGGYILHHTGGDYNLFLYVMAGMYVIGFFAWPFHRSRNADRGLVAWAKWRNLPASDWKHWGAEVRCGAGFHPAADFQSAFASTFSTMVCGARDVHARDRPPLVPTFPGMHKTRGVGTSKGRSRGRSLAPQTSGALVAHALLRAAATLVSLPLAAANPEASPRAKDDPWRERLWRHKPWEDLTRLRDWK